MPNTKALKYVLLFIILLSTSCRSSRLVKKAYKGYHVGEYYNSADLFKRAIRKVKKRDQKTEMTFLQAERYRLTNQDMKPDSKYKQAIRGKYPDSLVYLNVQLKIGRLKEAKANFEIYLEKHPENRVALNGVLACDSIPYWNKVKTRYEVKKFDDFNSRNSEFSPSFVGEDFDVVYFSSTREGLVPVKNSSITGQRNVDIFMSRMDSKNEWVDPEVLNDEAINTEFDDGVTSFTPDGKKMYFTRASFEAGKALGTKIFLSERSGAKWSQPKEVKFELDSLADTLVFAHPAISADGSELFFVSDYPGGFGGKDIWKVKNVAGKWSMPENLGPEINTAGDEKFPFVKPNGTLYFSSNGHPGLGGLDVYKAERITSLDDSDKFTWKVSNMLAPINSVSDDFGITFAGDEERGFLSSNRRDNRGYDHIYSFIKPEMEFYLEGAVKDEKTGDPISDAVIKLIGNDGTNVKIPTKKDGSFSQKIALNAEYVFLVTGRGYLNKKGELSTAALKDSKTFTFDFALASIKKPIRLNNIIYEFGSYELTDTAKVALQGLIQILKDNPNISIEISANTDFVGNAEANMSLSEKRAQAVVNFLIENSIKKDRLESKGYGEENPVVADKDLAKQYKFINEGDILNEAFILLQSKENQEIANRINRRTEFKVLSTNYKPSRNSNK